MGEYRDIGERLVAAASPRFKDFRVDFEKISTAASKAGREGRDGLTPEVGRALFFDLDWDLRTPLQHRYAEFGAMEAVAHYHAKRFKLILGRNTPWPDEPAEDALEMFAAHGCPDLGVNLARTYVEQQHKRLKSDYSLRNRRNPRVEHPEGVQRAIDGISAAIASAIPQAKADLLKDMETLAPYIETHGSADDRAWFESERRGLWMEKRA